MACSLTRFVASLIASAVCVESSLGRHYRKAKHKGCGSDVCADTSLGDARKAKTTGCGSEEWLRGISSLQTVGILEEGAPELLKRTPIAPMKRPPAGALLRGDYERLRHWFREPRILQTSNVEHGASAKVLVRLHDGWILPGGVVRNATHIFDLGVMKLKMCMRTGKRHTKVNKCWRTGARHIRCDCPEQDNWALLNTEWKECLKLDSVIHLADTIFNDYGDFHLHLLPRLLWPELQQLVEEATLLWDFNSETRSKPFAFAREWIKLLRLPWRSYVSPGPHTVVKFNTAYLPLWEGIDDEETWGSQVVVHAPKEDIKLFRWTTLTAMHNSKFSQQFGISQSYALILERHQIRRSLAYVDMVNIRHMMVAHFAGLQVRSIRGARQEWEDTQATFFVSPALRGPSADDRLDRPLTLVEGLRIFSRAKVIIGVHGGLMVHMLVAPRDAQLVELIVDAGQKCYYHLCSALGMKWWFQRMPGGFNDENLKVDLVSLDRLLALVANVSQLNSRGA